MTETLDDALTPKTESRRALLPTWIKVFLWIFMVFGAFAPVAIVLGVLGITFNMSLYSLETNNPLSPVGLLLISQFALKGVVSLGLWTEKSWAVKLAIVDGIISIVACAAIMVIVPLFFSGPGYHVNIRLELIAIIPYLITMTKIRADWESRS